MIKIRYLIQSIYLAHIFLSIYENKIFIKNLLIFFCIFYYNFKFDFEYQIY